MGVFLAFGFAFEGRSDDFGGGDLLLVGDVGCGARAAIAGVDQLNGAHCGDQRDGGDLEQTLGLLDLGFLQAQPIALHGAEDLFDAPAQPVQPHDFLRGGKCVGLPDDLQRGQQPPDDRLVAGGRRNFAHFQ